mmetsp:Transcript_25036/g.75466  ORF Transcript_25036/g.75466 Transcript_25036/m.75466 type:complete len:83 (-) Transcript_25036:114-362(-)
MRVCRDEFSHNGRRTEMSWRGVIVLSTETRRTECGTICALHDDAISRHFRLLQLSLSVSPELPMELHVRKGPPNPKWHKATS